MFGQTIDYWVLRSLTHTRNRATEAELDERANKPAPYDADKALARLRKLMHRFDGHFPIHDDLRYLDIGCGTGDITLALTRLGVGDVTGIDMLPRNIATAERYASETQTAARFVCDDIHRWDAPHRYHVVLSHEALEHIANPRDFLQRLTELVEPDGVALLAFGPLFYSPLGDHMWDFFKVQIPWRGFVFSEKAILKLRRERFRPTDPAARYPEIKGGLNLMRYSEFLSDVRDSGWEFEYLVVNPQLRKYGVALHLSNILVRTPGLRDYFAGSVYAKLRLRRSNL